MRRRRKKNQKSQFFLLFFLIFFFFLMAPNPSTVALKQRWQWLSEATEATRGKKGEGERVVSPEEALKYLTRTCLLDLAPCPPDPSFTGSAAAAAAATSPASCRGNCRHNPGCLQNLGQSCWVEGNAKEVFLRQHKLGGMVVMAADSLRKKTHADLTGLKNLGATCYLNSLMQILFNHPPFRSAVYSWRPLNGDVDEVGPIHPFSPYPSFPGTTTPFSIRDGVACPVLRSLTSFFLRLVLLFIRFPHRTP